MRAWLWCSTIHARACAGSISPVRATAAAMLSMSSTTNPVTPSHTYSGRLPSPKAITGVPQAAASRHVNPPLSMEAGTSSARAWARKAVLSAPDNGPSATAPGGMVPVPAIWSGLPASRAACTAASGPLCA